MPTVHTISGARRRKRKSTRGPRTAQQRAFAGAAKQCKGKPGFQACMRKKLS